MAKLRAALVGLGIMGANHARVLSTLDGVDLVAVSDPKGDQQGALPNQEILKSVDEVIAKGLDYCVIAAPTAMHEEISLQLINSGVHLLVEKPLSHTFLSASRIVQAANEKGIIGAVGHIERFNAALQEARLRILRGELGQIHQISTRRLGPFPTRIADVGVILDLATHDIDLASWLGTSHYVNVFAQSCKRSRREHEDLVAVTATLENKIIINHLVNWISPFKERITTITGEKGAFIVDSLTSDLTYFANGTLPVTQDRISHYKGMSQGEIVTFAFPKPEPLIVEHQQFRDAILGKPSEIVTFAEGCENVRVAEAITQSTLQSCVVKL